jgi:type VI secretion system secreted protein VgrG
MAITQNNRLVQVDSPLGGDVLLLQSMEGREELGRLFHYELDLTSEDRSITFDQLLGKPMGLNLELHDGGKRYFHGIA